MARNVKSISPRGVKEIVKVQGNVDSLMKSPTSPKKTKKTKKDAVKSKTSNAVKRSQKKTSTVLSSNRMEDLKRELKECQDRLKWLANQTEKDHDEYQQKLVDAKARLRKDMREQFAPMLTPDKNLDARAHETQKIIHYLREDNARIRDEIQYHKKMIDQMKKKNEALRATNARVDNTFDSLSGYVKQMEAANVKLLKNTEVYKAHLKTMKEKLKERDAHFVAEANTADIYEESIEKILKTVGNRCKDAQLIDQTIELTDDALKKAKKGKAMELKKVGLAEVPITERRSAKAKKQNRKKEECDSDSDYDSDDE